VGAFVGTALVFVLVFFTRVSSDLSVSHGAGQLIALSMASAGSLLGLRFEKGFR